MGVIENKEELWLPGEMTTEIWYDAGRDIFPLPATRRHDASDRLQGGLFDLARLMTQGQDGLHLVRAETSGERMSW